MSDKMREEFEREWGQVDAEQGVHFIPELNTYGSELYAQHGYAQMKSSAWFYFQKGWQASREALVIELPPLRPEPTTSGDELKASGEAASWGIWVGEKLAKTECREAIEAAGLKVKP